MRILITGSAGMLGHDLLATAAQDHHDVVALTRTRLDVTDVGAVEAAVTDAQPELVINCAAWTDVDGAEQHVVDAHRVNGAGAGNVARAALKAGAWTVHVSSDYVFDGSKGEPYLESDPVAPASVYGASKLEGELAVARAAPERHTIVRSSWLFGTGGPCFPATIMRLAAERDRLTVVADQIGCPTSTAHLAHGLLQLACGPRDPPLGVLHVAGGGHCSWFEFADQIVARAGIECEVTPVTTAEFPRPAPRPAYSVLRSERGDDAPQLPDWRRGLDDYLALSARLASA